jgi:hypothetical protein
MTKSMTKSMTKFWTARINPLFALALAGMLVSAIGTPSRAADNARESAEKTGETVKAADSPFWVPAARLATDKPQRIEVNNKTGVTLEYLITTHTDFRTLAPGKSVTLTNFTTPVFVNINPQESNYLVAYKVSVNAKTNTLVVNVTLTNNPDNRTLNLDETGAVYLY